MTRPAALAVVSAAACLWVSVVSAPAQEGDALLRAFAQPPDSAKPHTWWHRMNGNISAEGITLDLEAMKAVGIGGAQIFDVTVGIPPGPVKYLSPEWLALVKHSIQEADRLGIEVCMHNCAGWSSSGGPWITPELSMQMLVFSEMRVRGPARFSAPLPQPHTRRGYYREAALLAFPTPTAETAPAADDVPHVTAGVSGFAGERLVDGDLDTHASLALRRSARPQYIQLEYPRPFTARSLTVYPGAGRDTVRAELQASGDGVTFTKVADLSIRAPNLLRCPTAVNFSAHEGRVFRLVFSAPARAGSVSLAEVRLSPGFRIADWGVKAGFDRGAPRPDRAELPANTAIARGSIRDLSPNLSADGVLTWDVPEGDWTILRFGHTTTGKENHPAPEEGRGLECDKLSKQAAEAHFAGMLGKVIADIGPLAGTTLKQVLIDSYEVDCQNWTAQFPQEFRARRGHDLLQFLPVMTGRVVDSLDTSERVLWDIRRTIADLFADNYFGHYATLCHRHGIELAVEPYGNGNFDDLAAGARADVPMSEFWVEGWGVDNAGSKLAASVAHTNGRKFVGAEAFTTGADAGRWLNSPYSLKALGDAVYCGGVNRFIFHRYAHQPWREPRPGMTMGPHGLHFDRGITWWEQAPAWTAYLTRCQHLLQEGLFFADICCLTADNPPASLSNRVRLGIPPGYDYDGCHPETFLSRMSVREGRLTLPDGMSYRLLVLPDAGPMRPAVLRKLRDLVREGATVCGPPPPGARGLEGYPQADEEVRALADEMWGDCDGETVTEHALGAGKVLWGRPLGEVLLSLGLPPDFEAATDAGPLDLRYIHRTIGEAEVYFVASAHRRPLVADCTFRVAGKTPELWHPDTGRAQDAPLFREQDGRTTVTLRLEPSGSVFVVFRRPAPADHLVSVTWEGVRALASAPQRLPTLEIRRAVYGILTEDLPDMVDVTEQVSRMVRDDALTVVASNSLAGDPAPNVVKQMRVDYTLDGREASKTVDEHQTLRLPEPGQSGVLQVRRAVYGILPDGPLPSPESRSVDVTERLAAMVEGNMLSVVADNSLAGDPAPQVVKQLRVEYLLDGEPYTRTLGENRTLVIPDGSEKGGAPPPALADIAVNADGIPVLTAWQAGAYDCAWASGRASRVEVAGVPEPLEVPGPWEVVFPPGLGAPPRAVFEELACWTRSDDPGVRHFSGTATYRKDPVIPAELTAPGHALVLDLGAVCEIAEVTLNGTESDVLWKPPFRVDVTDIVRPGTNRLEVRVTNLWPNRLIGDAQIPADFEETPGGPLRSWPDWLLAGTPRPSERIAFTTWNHWSADSSLLPSGLLGPVTMRVGRTVALQ